MTVGDVLDLERKAFEYAIVSHTTCVFLRCNNHLFFEIPQKLESTKLGEEMDGILKRYKGDLVKAAELAKAKKLDSSQPEQPTV